MNKKVTLQEPQSRGGEIATGGFDFQENILISRIPECLNNSNFAGFTIEAIGDVEIKYFALNNDLGSNFELLEAKNHIVKGAEFWLEIKRFMQIDKDNPGMYIYFILACTGVAPKTSPITNTLRRIKGPYAFYGGNSVIINNSFNEFKLQVKEANHNEKEASFLFEKVIVKDDYSSAHELGELLFMKSFTDNFTQYDNLATRVKKNVYHALKELVGANRNKFVNRRTLENLISNSLELGSGPHKAIKINTCINDDEGDVDKINFYWSSCWGGENRTYPSVEIWNETVVQQLKEAKRWILEFHNTRRIELFGNRRLSSAIAIGSIFSAVAGFSIDLDYRGQIWPTDAHADKLTPDYNMISMSNDKSGDEMIISIGIIHDISSEVGSYLRSESMESFPALYINGPEPLLSPQQANKAISEIKKIIISHIAKSNCKKIHLFYAGPSFLALLLGHRLNATAEIQCYERIAPNVYQPTCLLSLK